nr:MAG TPA: hypothetical protein [Caudoviricetes sp.]
MHSVSYLCLGSHFDTLRCPRKNSIFHCCKSKIVNL